MIRRDGSCTSIWQNTVEPYKVVNREDPSLIYDVAIVGGGITGITTAFLLQQAGLKCIVLEGETLCFGTTGGTTAHLNTLLDTPYSKISKNFSKEKAALVAAETTKAIALVRKHIQEFQIDCGFEEAEAYLFAKSKDQSEELNEIYPAAIEAGESLPPLGGPSLRIAHRIVRCLCQLQWNSKRRA